MKIYIETLINYGRTILLDVESIDTIEVVKANIEKCILVSFQIECPAVQQRLILAGKTLENGKTLADYNVQEKATLFLSREKLQASIHEPLLAAIIEGDLEKTRNLIDNEGEDVDKENIKCLLFAVIKGHLEIAQLLINKGAHVKISYDRTLTVDGSGPLMIAILNGQLEMVKLLVTAGSNVNERSRYGFTPLIMASKTQNWEIVEFLVSANANVNEKKDTHQTTALIIASMHGNMGIVQLLLTKGADANTTVFCNTGMTALMEASSKGHLEIVQLLVTAGANVNVVNPWCNCTALIYASKNGHLEVAEFLITKGADMNAQKNERYNTYSFLDVAQFMIIKGADVNAKKNQRYNEDNGFTALMYASMNGHLSIAKLLVNNQADLNKVTANGKNALDIAKKHGHQEIAQLLIDAGLKSTEKVKEKVESTYFDGLLNFF
jgi:ankyrin repeat protein